MTDPMPLPSEGEIVKRAYALNQEDIQTQPWVAQGLLIELAATVERLQSRRSEGAVEIAVGDILEWSDNMGSPHRWRVKGIHLGAVGQESLIEMESVTHKPGWTGEWEWHPVVWVPEVLCRHLRKVKP